MLERVDLLEPVARQLASVGGGGGGEDADADAHDGLFSLCFRAQFSRGWPGVVRPLLELLLAARRGLSAEDMSRTRPRHVRDMSETCHAHVREKVVRS